MCRNVRNGSDNGEGKINGNDSKCMELLEAKGNMSVLSVI